MTDTPDKQLRIIEVIVTTLEVRGKGTQDDPKRRVTQYWSRDGELLVEDDRYAPTHCNAVGHRFMPGAVTCAHCDATLAYVVRAAGATELAKRIECTNAGVAIKEEPCG